MDKLLVSYCLHWIGHKLTGGRQKSYAASRSFDPSTLQAAIFLTSGNQKQNQLKLVSADNTVQDVVEMLHENGYLAFGEGIELIVFEDKSRARATV